MASKLADVTKIYSEDQKLKKKDVEELTKWVETQPHLPNIKELQVILFLNSCYYELEPTKVTIEKYFKFKNTSSLFTNVTEDMVKKTLESCFIGFMPKRTPEGDAILFVRLLDPRPELYNCLEHCKVLVAVILLYFHQFGPANGFISVVDMVDSCLGHLLRINILTIRQLMYFSQEAAPVKMKSVHNINCIPITQRFMALVKPFMKKELNNMIHLHVNLDTLFEYIPKECFMEDYGGFLPPMKEVHEKNIETVLRNFDILKWLETQTADESKRVKKERSFFGTIQNMFR